MLEELHSLYRQLITSEARTDELHRKVDESVRDLRARMEQFERKLEGLSESRIGDAAALNAELVALSRRLDMLSEQTLHVAANNKSVVIEHGESANRLARLNKEKD